jgi:hypothetical protein
VKSIAPPESSAALDSIEWYLADPPIPTSVITETGGYIKYWAQAFSTHPLLAKMGSDYCSAPGIVFFFYSINSGS